jgi:predicted transcriptional regulator
LTNAHVRIISQNAKPFASASLSCPAVSSPADVALTRRERQIMDVLHRRGRATAAEVRAELPDAPGYSSVRKLLEILEGKGHVRHDVDGPRYVYTPAQAPERARRSALRQLLDTYFAGSPSHVVAALLELSGPALTDAELDRIAALAEDAKREGR